MAGELLMGISKDQRERAIFRSRRKFQSDRESDLITAKRIGREESDAKWRDVIAAKEASLTAERIGREKSDAKWRDVIAAKEASLAAKWRDVIAEKESEISRLREQLKSK